MEKTRDIVVTIVVLAFGLIFASIAASAAPAHAQTTNNTGGNMTSMANKTNATKSPSAMGGGNATSPSSAKSAITNATSAGGGATNATSAGGGATNATNATNATSSNPLAKVPIIGKLFGGK